MLEENDFKDQGKIMNEVKTPDAASTPEAVVARIQEQRNRLQRQSEKYSRFRWPIFLVLCLIGAFVGVAIYLDATPGESWKQTLLNPTFLFIAIPAGALAGGSGYWLFTAYLRFLFSALIEAQDKLLTGVGIVKLQETLEEDFFTKLVKINFKYIDQYYLQTQSQANKSFRLSATVASIAFLIIGAGIVLMFWKPTTTTQAYVTTAAGVLAEFIAAVFFYLYNRTIIKMSEYHQKPVITQNISLALKIAEGLPETERVLAQVALTQQLTRDCNKYLTQFLSEEDK